jgi:hypothetical protein
VPDQRSAIGAVIGGLMLLRDKPFQLLDGVRAFEREVLAVEAVHLDTAIVRHHLLEAEMGERAQVHQFADRKIDPDAVVPRRHQLPAGVISLAPADGADGVAEDPEPGLIAIDALFVGRPARERADGLDRPADMFGGWPASS